MRMPPNIPEIERKFADPQEALDSPDVFLTRFNIRYGRWDTFTGHAVTGEVREAMVSGVEYYWERTNVKIQKALIWRTAVDDMSVAGASGSMLCLGKMSTRTCKPILFQNLESRILKYHFWMADTVRNIVTGSPKLATYKAGFRLPADVKNARIIFEEGPIQR